MIEFSYIVSITDILATVIDNLEKQKYGLENLWNLEFQTRPKEVQIPEKKSRTKKNGATI